MASPTVGHLCVLIFLLIFQVNRPSLSSITDDAYIRFIQILLAFYLEQALDLSFIVVCLPLYIALIILIYMSFSSRVPANHCKVPYH